MVTKILISRMFSVVLVVMFLLTGSLPMQTAMAAASNTADQSADELTQINALEPAAADARMAGSFSPAAELVSPQGLLNPDGTLQLDGSTSASLDLSGWDVQIDPERGPVFSSLQSVEQSLLSSITVGSWSDLGGGGGSSINDIIFAIAVNGSDVYVGGWFTDVDNIPEADHVAKWNGTNWSALGSNGAGGGSIGSTVYSITVSGSDVYVGGFFFNVNNNGTALPAADHIARWNGTNWSALGSGIAGNGSLNSAVYAIAVSGSDVYVGGQFTDVNNNGTPLPAADYIARWNGTDWSALGDNGTGNGSINGIVLAIAISGLDVYVGGYFINVNNNGTPLPAADYIAKWAGGNWSALSSNGAGEGSLNNAVNAIAISGSDVYVGGNFTDVKDGLNPLNAAADYIARWDGTNWFALGSGIAGNGSLNAHVNAIAISGSNVYVGGQFADVKSAGFVWYAADYIARWDGSGWTSLSSDGVGNGSLNNAVLVMASSGSNVYIAGYFDNVNNNGSSLSQALFTAKWDGFNWSAMGAGQGSIIRPVNVVTVSGTDVYVGGYFKNVSNGGTVVQAADNIAKWDGADWSALGSDDLGNGAIDGSVLSIAVSGTDVYVGGAFYVYDTNFSEAVNIAKWDGVNWSAMGDHDAFGNGSLNGQVNAIAVSGSNVYAGGYFFNVKNNGTPLPAADYIAKWDGTDWSALGSDGAGEGSLNSAVNAIAVSGSNLYVGGWFSDVNNNGTPLLAADFIAMWNGANWSALGSNGAGNGSLNSIVYAVAVSGANVYVGGQFYDVRNGLTPLNAADYIARWNGTNWSALGSNGSAEGSLNNKVLAIAVNGSNVYAGGYFFDVNDNGTTNFAADYVAKWNGSNWSSLGSDGAGDGSVGGPTNPYINAVGTNGTEVYIGGDFFNVNNNGIVLPYADYVAVYVLSIYPIYLPLVTR